MLKYLIEKEWLQIRRNAFLPQLIVMFPITMMCVMPWIMNLEVKNIRVDVVDNDRSTRSIRLIGSVFASNCFVQGGQLSTWEEAFGHIETKQADVVMVIPPHFSRDLANGLHPQVLVAVNAVNGTKGSIGGVYLSQIISAHVEPSASAIRQKVSSLFLYNKNLDYKVYMIPALLAEVLMLLCGFLPAFNIVGEKEAGTIEQMNVTPVPKWAFILSKLIPYWMIALFVLGVCLLLSWLVYDITCQGSLWLVLLLSVLFSLFCSSLGLVISNYSHTMYQAVFVMWFFVVCMLLLSGLYTPTRSMPDWAYLTTYVNPMCYFIDAIRTVFVRGGDFHSMAHQMLALLCAASVMGVWAVGSYRKNR